MAGKGYLLFLLSSFFFPFIFLCKLFKPVENFKESYSVYPYTYHLDLTMVDGFILLNFIFCNLLFI